MLVGYARVSTLDQKPALQTDALKAAGCGRIFTEKASGAQRDRPELNAALDYLRSGDTLVVWKLDRLARSMRQLIETVEDLQARGIELRSLTESIDTATPGGRLSCFTSLAPSPNSSVLSSANAQMLASKRPGSVARRAADLRGSARESLPPPKRCSPTPRSAWRM